MQTKAINLKVWATAFLGTVAAAVVVALVVGSEPAHATPPGDKGKIAFASNRAGSFDIWVMNANGNDPVQLTNDPLPEVFPAWSPDRTKIAFSRGVRGGTDIFVINADGTGEKQLTFALGGDVTPTWSPDGEKIAFTHVNPADFNRDIYVVNADGTGEQNLTNNPAFDSDPDWSPNGKRIAFNSDRSGDAPFVESAVYTMRPDGRGVRQLTNLNLNAFAPAWSPQGDKLAFSDEGCLECTESDLFVMKASGTGVTQITDTPEDETGALNETGATWSPDGERIAFENFRLQRVTDPDTGETHLEFVAGSGEIYVIGNDGEGRKNLTNSPGVDDQHPDWSPEQDD